MYHTEDHGIGGAVTPLAGLTLTAATGLAELLIAAVTALMHAASWTAGLVRQAATLFRGTADNAPHIALLRVPGEFVTGTWRRV